MDTKRKMLKEFMTVIFHPTNLQQEFFYDDKNRIKQQKFYFDGANYLTHNL